MMTRTTTDHDQYVSQPEISSQQERAAAYAEEHFAVAAFQVLIRLTRRKWLIAKVSGTAMILGVIISLILPLSYTATTKIMTPQQIPSSASLLMSQMANSGGGQLAMAAAGGLGLRNPNDVYIGLLNSRPVADAVIEEFGLRSVYRAKDMTAARMILEDKTAVSSEKGGFITVSVTDRDKVRAARIANAYTEQLRMLTKTLALTEASQRRIFYEEQLKHAKEDVISAELVFRQVQQKRGLVQLDAQAKAVIGLLAGLHAQVSAKQVELQALRSYSTEKNSDVQLTESQLSSLEQEVSTLEQRGRPSDSTDLGLQDVAGAGIEYLRAEHELQYRQILFDLLLKQYDVAKLDEAKDAAVVQVVEPAIAPERKSAPNRGSTVMIFTLLGVVAACSYLFITDYSRKNPQLARSLAEFSTVLRSR
jgi:tyrosine-protein kinase Etk/Wzc